MEVILPLALLCGWHLGVLAVGVWIGFTRPWRWRIVRDNDDRVTDQEGSFARVR